MNLYIVSAMAALGIGGGLAGLAWGWREGLREAADKAEAPWATGGEAEILAAIYELREMFGRECKSVHRSIAVRQ